jgi:hypothetical protein
MKKIRIQRIVYLALSGLILNWISIASGYGQESPDTLIFRANKVFKGNYEELDKKHLKALMVKHPDALRYLNKAQESTEIAMVFYALGVVSGVPAVILGKEMQRKENYEQMGLFLTLGGASCSFIVIGAVIESGYKKKLKKSVRSYNRSILVQSRKDVSKMELIITPGLVGLRFNL